MDELKPCPFCGSENVRFIFWDDDETTGECTVKCEGIDCPDAFDYWDTPEIVAKMWNTRWREDELQSEVERQAAEIERLRGALEDALVELYNMDDCRTPYYAVAKLCDEKLDRSGALLGRVRQRARILKGGTP